MEIPLPVNIEITDDEILVTVEDGTKVRLDRQDGGILTTRTAAVAPPKLFTARKARTPAPQQIRVSPRWMVHVGDPVMGQHKKGGRKFLAKVRAIKEENGGGFVQVADPRNGGTYLLPLDRICRPPRGRVAS
jgi:hypothetical protein